jgi:phosphopantothenoylcysteine decarboxylase/phosphopantothenate--cysteine ligase
VTVQYPSRAEVISVISTDEMLEACQLCFPSCEGLIGAAAPCDYQPVRIETHKIAKTGEPLMLHLVETADVVATLGADKRSDQWVVGFALETDDQRFRAITKLEKKSCDLIVLNGPEAMNSHTNSVEVLDRTGQVVKAIQGSKDEVGRGILRVIQQQLIHGGHVPDGGT